jgi:RND family efflux transporter MFP subunit
MQKPLNKSTGTRAILLAIITAAFLLSCGCQKEVQVKEEVVKAPVIMTAVEKGEIEREISFTGVFRAKNRVELLPKMPGMIEKVMVDEGDRVKKGQLLVKLQDDDLRAQIDQAFAAIGMAQARLGQAQSGHKLTSSSTGVQVQIASKGVDQAREGVIQAQSSHDHAKREYDRMSELFNRGAVSEQTRDNVKTQYQIAQSRLESARVQEKQARESLRLAMANTGQADVSRSDVSAASAGIAQAQANIRYLQVLLDYTEIRSPIDGTVTGRNAEPGQLVSPGDKDPTMTVTDNSLVYLESNLPESDGALVRLGQAVGVKAVSIPSRSFKGVIKAIIPSADPMSKTLRIKVAIDNPDQAIKHGMSGMGQMSLEKLQGVVIPRNQLKIMEGEFYVVKADEKGRAAHVKITPGYYNEEHALILKGLSPGDRIISHGHDTLKDGDLLDVKEQAKPAKSEDDRKNTVSKQTGSQGH